MAAGRLIHVLYIDDDPSTIRSISRILTNAPSFQLEMASTLDDGLKTLRTYPADTILLNLNLPDSQGLATLERVQRHQLHKPVVALLPPEMENESDFTIPLDGAQAYLSTRELSETAVIRSLRCAFDQFQAEQALRESERRFRAMFEQAPMGMAYADLEGRFFLVNLQLCRMTGFERDELLQRSFADLTHPDDVEPDRLMLDRLIAGEQSSYTKEKRYLRKDGSVMWVEATIALARSTWNESPYFYGIVEDITPRKRAEEAQLFLAAIVESSEDGIIGKALDGTIRSWNAASERMYGYTANEVVGRSIKIIFPPGSDDEFDDIFARIRRGEHIARYETQRVRKDGRVIDIALTVSPIKDEREHIIGAAAIERDISERKSAQAALAESEARLRQVTENIQEVLTLQDVHTGEMLYVSPAYEAVFGRTVDSLYADPRSFLDAVRPDDREMLVAAMQNQGEDNLDVQYRIVHPSGEERWIHMRTFPIYDKKDEAYRRAGIIEDITDFKRLTMAEHELRVFAEALRHTANALTSTLDMNEVLDRILSSIERVVPHNAADIMLIEDGVARVVGSRGYAEQDLEGVLLSESYVVEETAHLAYMAERRQPLIIPDVHSDITPREFEPSPAWFWHSYAGMPICLKDEVLGFINLGSNTPYFFTPVHADRLEAFAEQAAIAIQNARLHEQARRLATHQERQRLARDLHDAVSQTLFSAAISAEALARQWKRSPDKVGPQIDELHRLTRGALAETRAALLELRPAALVEIPFEALVQQLIDAAQSRKKLDILARIDRQDKLPAEVKEVFYRVTQEALNNIVKHAQAAEVEIRFRRREGRAWLVISDDGQGFDTTQIAPTSLGMGIMRERAESIGARLDVTSVPGEGTRLTLNWKEGAESNHE